MKHSIIKKTALVTVAVQLLSPLSLALTSSVALASELGRVSPEVVTDTEGKSIEGDVARAATSAGTFLSNSHSSNAATSRALGLASSHASAEAERWLGQFGTVKTTINIDHTFSLKGSSFDLLYPLFDMPELLTFTQGGIRHIDDRTQSTIGFGVRNFSADSMLGANTFIDHDMSRSHTRAGVGVEYWRDNLRLGANGYMRLSDWKDSADISNYLERPASGWDVKARSWLPAIPQLGASIGFEQYYGNEVGLFGRDNRQRSPYAATYGLNWTPFPLLSMNAEQRQGKGSASDTSIGLELRYALGLSWSQQTNPGAVSALHSLAGGRMELVERNNNIVLEYEKKELISLKVQEYVSGYAGEQKPLVVEVKSEYPVERIEWNAPELEAAGGLIASSGIHSHFVTIPNWTGTDSLENVYTVRGVAVDNRGNRSAESVARVVVSQAAINPGLSGLNVTSMDLVPDGISSQTVTLNLYDASGNPFDVAEGEIVVERTDVVNKNTSRSVGTTGSRTQVSPFIRSEAGRYEMTVTAGTEAEHFILTPSVRGFNAGGLTVNVSQPASELNSALALSSDTADIDTAVKVSLSLRDMNNEALNGQNVTFTSSREGVTFTPVQHSGDGIYTSQASSTVTGIVNIGAVINGAHLEGVQAQVTFNAGTASESTSTLVADKMHYSSGDDVVLTLDFKDSAGNSATVDIDSAVFTTPNLQEKDAAWTTNADGTLTRTWTAGAVATGLKAGIKLSSWSTPVETAAYDIAAGVAVGGNSDISTDKTTYGAGDTMTLTVSLKDMASNPLVGFAMADVDVTVQNATPETLSWIDNGDGTYTRTYKAQQVGNGLKAILKLNGWSDGLQTVEYSITAGAPYADISELSLDDTTYVVGENMTMTLTLKDSEGNLVGNADMTGISTIMPGNTSGQEGDWVEKSPGVYVGKWRADTIVSTATPSVVLASGGSVIGQSAVSIVDGPMLNPLSKFQSTINGRMSGGEVFTVKLQILDAQNKPIRGLSGYIDRNITMQSDTQGDIEKYVRGSGGFKEKLPGVYEKEFESRVASTGNEFSLAGRVSPSFDIVDSAINYTMTTKINGSDLFLHPDKYSVSVGETIKFSQGSYVLYDDTGNPFNLFYLLEFTKSDGLSDYDDVVAAATDDYVFTAIAPVNDEKLQMCGSRGLAQNECLYSQSYTITP